MLAYVDALRRDSAVYAFIGGYSALVVVLSGALDMSRSFQPLSVLGTYLRFGGLALLLVLFWLTLRSRATPRPLISIFADVRSRMEPDMLAKASMILALAVFMSVFGSAKALLPNINPFWADRMLAGLDVALSGGRAPWTYFPRDPKLTLAVDLLYGWGWFTIMFTSICVGAMSDGPRRQQYLWTFLITWALLGNVIACLMMSGGPVYYEQLTGHSDFSLLSRDVAAHAPWSLAVRDLLWLGYSNKSSGLAQGISAFPSMHLAISTLFVLQVRHMGRRFFVAGVALCTWVLASSIYLGWHYAVDGYFSIAITIVIWKVAGLALRTRSNAGFAFQTETVPVSDAAAA